eukprot:s777_g46.t1
MAANDFDDVTSLMWAMGRLAMKDVSLIAPWQAKPGHGRPSRPVSIFFWDDSNPVLAADRGSEFRALNRMTFFDWPGGCLKGLIPQCWCRKGFDGDDDDDADDDDDGDDDDDDVVDGGDNDDDDDDEYGGDDGDDGGDDGQN